MRNTFEKLALAAAVLTATPACNEVNGQAVDQLQATQQSAVNAVITATEAAPQNKYGIMKDLFNRLKTVSAQKHAGTGPQTPDQVAFKSATGQTIKVRITSHGENLELTHNGEIFFVDLGTSIPFKNDCALSVDGCPQTDDENAIIEKGLRDAFTRNTESEGVFKAFGLTEQDSPEKKATVILQALIEKM